MINSLGSRWRETLSEGAHGVSGKSTSLSDTVNHYNGRILFQKKLGRTAFLKHVLAAIVGYRLLYLARKHTSQNRKQLVVFSFDLTSNAINIAGVYEKKHLDAFFEWLVLSNVKTKQFDAINVGAYIGNHSLYFSDYFRRVYSFEPNPRAYKVLCLNAELVRNVECFNFGLSDSHKFATLSGRPSNISGWTTNDSLSSNSLTVELKTLDSVPHMEEVRLIKIDVGGSEYAVIIGARNLILRNKPILMFAQGIKNFTNGKSKEVSLLKELGYNKFVVLSKTPSVGSGIILKALTLPMLRTVFGESMRLEMASEIKPGSYPFVVAMPDWFPVPTTAQ